MMNRYPTSRAIARSGWSDELATALGDAERVVSQLIADGVSNIDTARLRPRLVELRAELQQLKRAGLADDRLVKSTWPVRAGASWPSDQTPWGSSPPPENSSMNGPIGGAGQPAVAQKPRLRKAGLP